MLNDHKDALQTPLWYLWENKHSENFKRVRNKNNTLERINSRLDNTEEQINELEGRIVEIIEAESKKEKQKWGQFKRPLGWHQAY